MGREVPDPVSAYLDWAETVRDSFVKLEGEGVLYAIEHERVKHIEKAWELISEREDPGFYRLQGKAGRKAPRLFVRFPAYRFFHKFKVGDSVFVRRPKETKTYLRGVLVDVIEPRTSLSDSVLNKYYLPDVAKKLARSKKLIQVPRYVVLSGDEYIVLEDGVKMASNLKPCDT